jgi:hypothetical protein
MQPPASVRCWPLLWSPPLPIQSPFPIRARLLGQRRASRKGTALEWLCSSRASLVPSRMGIWNTSSDGFSFVISYESRSGPGFHGPAGYVASWRSLSQNTVAIRVGGSPFETLAEAEEACKAMLGHLTRNPDGE